MTWGGQFENQRRAMKRLAVIKLYENGRAFAESVIDSAAMRLRPIPTTALMAGLGLLPAALSHRIGSETQRPFAVVIVGSIVSATVFTLLLMPPLLIRLRPKQAHAASP